MKFKYLLLLVLLQMSLSGCATSAVGAIKLNGQNVEYSSFSECDENLLMCRYEVTYDLWYQVVSLSKAKLGYKFANEGCEGYCGKPGAKPSSRKFEPVTMVSWRDCIVWCNALSELTGEKPVYYKDKECKVPLKESLSDTEVFTEAGSIDRPFVKADSKGYRLPLSSEWELAARGGNPSKDVWSSMYCGIELKESDTEEMVLEKLKTVAWFYENSFAKGKTDRNYGTHEVGKLKKNTLGLYDMNGNVWEWCFDSYIDEYSKEGNNKIQRGGSWLTAETFCNLSYYFYNAPYSKGNGGGFRICKTR